jgi:hypothetical protein
MAAQNVKHFPEIKTTITNYVHQQFLKQRTGFSVFKNVTTSIVVDFTF